MKKANLTHYTICATRRPTLYFARLFFMLLIFNGTTYIAWSQQGNVWYFGNKAGLSFNTNPPSALLDGQLATYEGCASICDNNGQLLFYTEGSYVWNKAHQVMPNGTGLKGNFSSTNSAIIIPKPGSATIYYIFTAAAIPGNEGYFFSEVDMSLNGGLGDVTGNKNILLYAPSTEKLTAARHSNGIDVWVITKALGNTTWKAFKVDCNGVNTIPVTSNAGAMPVDFWKDQNVGCMKTSPDGTKIAAVNTAEARWELLRFDAATGVVSNGLLFSGSGTDRIYGVEFSPDSKLLYISSEWLPPSNVFGGIHQYNLATYDVAAIESTKKLIGTSFDWVGALQLGPDNKIYCAVQWFPYLSVINAPNVPGMACNFVDRQVDLEEDKTPFRGLPVFFPGLIISKNADFNYTTDTDCSTVNFVAGSTIPGNVNWQWNFGDGTTGNGQQITHTYSGNGPAIDTVTLTITSTGLCGSAIAVKKINVNPGKSLAKFGFVRQCGYRGVSFYDSSVTSSNSIQTWLWDFGDGVTSAEQHPTHTFNAYGSYTVRLTIATPGSCNAFASVQKDIVVEAVPVADFSYTRNCINQPVSFTDESAIAFGNINQWYWDFGNGNTSTLQNPQTTFAVAGNYKVKLVTRAAGCISDTVLKNITVEDLPAVAFTNTEACIGKTITFSNNSTTAFGAITGYTWDFGDATTSTLLNPVHQYNQEGNFTTVLKAFTQNGCTATATATFHIAPVRAFAGNDTTATSGQPLQLQATGGAVYQWSPPDFLNTVTVSNPVAILEKDQRYRVKITTQEGCTGFDDINIRVFKAPGIHVPNGFTPGAGRNNIFRPILAGVQELYYFSVYNRWGQLIFITREQGKGWDGRINGMAQQSGTFTWMLKAKDYQGHLITRNGTVLLLR